MYLIKNKQPIHNIGFVSTRFQGTDGVSLETEKWVHVLRRMGYDCFFYAGLSDWDAERTMVEPLAFFDDPQIRDIQEQCFGVTRRSNHLTGEIHRIRNRLKTSLYRFIREYTIDLLIVENAAAIPMNIPLGLAITELIAEENIPSIGHHHDFYWERQRFLVNAVNDYISMAFPPKVNSMVHVVINSEARKAMSYRRGLSSYVVPNVFDYKTPIPVIDDYTRNLRAEFGIAEDDIFVLQPTRVVARKGIEHAIELVSRMKNKKAKIVISHQAKDEGRAYYHRILDYASYMGVDLIIKPEIIGACRGTNENGAKIYSLWDLYPHADFVTYPSTYEGFGNAFLEAVFFKKPIFVNRYSIYQQDIEPAGFDVVAMDTYVTDQEVQEVQDLLENSERRERMVDKNFALAHRYFSYEVLEQQLRAILINFGEIET